MFKILTLNKISPVGLDKFPRDRYEVASEIPEPDAILLRSHKLHDMAFAKSVKAVARAGAGYNNVPVDKLTALGVPVFNTPGANANAVKELVITGMLLACRHVCAGWDFARGLSGEDQAITKKVEEGKKQFVGFELQGRTLGVIGLGAIGVKVANAAIALGMNVIGYDPHISVQRAWELSSKVVQATSVGEVLSQSDFVTMHVPLMDETHHMINASRLALLKETVVLLNFAREGIIDEEALKKALDNEKLHVYVTDFPSKILLNHQRVINLPHLGASTKEAEENCAVMAAEQLRDYLENGNIHNSVNFPEINMLRDKNCIHRLAVANANVPNMVAQVSACLAEAHLNIIDLLNKSRNDVAYTLIDADAEIPASVIDAISSIKGVLSVRVV